MTPDIVSEITDVVRTGIAGFQAFSEARQCAVPGPEVAVAEPVIVVPGCSTAIPGEAGPEVVRGRGDVVADLVRKADAGCGGRPQLLTGAGGMGKSTIARLAAARLWELDQRRRIWWISAVDEERLSGGLISLARDLGASAAIQETIRSYAAADLGGVIDLVWHLLEQVAPGWLLVIDNADDPGLLGPPDGTGWVRNARRGVVLITTRNSDEACWPDADLIRVGPLPPEASADVLKALAPAAGDRAAARVLAERLGGLPLALRIAGMHLRQEFASWQTFGEYLGALENKGAAVVIDASRRPDRRAAVTQTWELSLDALASAGLPQARPLLWLLSCYPPGSRIPEEMITAPGLAASSPHLVRALLGTGRVVPAEEWARRCLEGLRGLASVSLISRSDAADRPRAIELHPFISEITRAVMNTDSGGAGIESSAVRECAATALTATVKALDTGSAEHWPAFQLLTPHVLDLLNHTAPHLRTRLRHALLDCMVHCIAAYMWSRAEPRAQQLASSALELALRLGASDDAVYLRLQHAYAWSLREQGRLTDAEQLFSQVLAKQLSLPDGPMRADTLHTRHDLAWTIGRSGRWQEAEQQFRDILRCRLELRRQRGQAGDEPDILHTRCMLCWSVGKQGRWQEAEQEYRLLGADRAAILGPQHADTLDTRENVGKSLAWQGNWTEAELEWRQVATLRERTLGSKNPDTLRTRQLTAYAAGHLARTHKNRAGRLAAVACLEQVLEIQAHIRGHDHKETLETRALLAALRGKSLDGFLWPEDLPQPC